MKIVGIFLGIVLCFVGIFAGLLFTHKIPAAKLAKASPAAAGILTKLGLYHTAKSAKAAAASKPDSSTASASAPAISKDDADEKQSLDAERQQIAAERDALDKSRSASTATPAQPNTLAPKLADIYDTMSPDDLARIFAKQGDNQVVLALSAMDEKKAGKVMAALPADRAAKLALLLNQQPQPATAAAA